MRTSEGTKMVLASLLAVQGAVGKIAKDKTNPHDRYAYASLESYNEALKAEMVKFGLALVTSPARKVTPLDPRETKGGGLMYAVLVEATMRLSHAESGEWIEIDIIGEGYDRGDKAVYKAITGARKYGLACLFDLVTTDDPETDSPEASRPRFEPTRANGARQPEARPQPSQSRPQQRPADRPQQQRPPQTTTRPAPTQHTTQERFPKGQDKPAAARNVPPEGETREFAITEVKPVKTGQRNSTPWTLYKVVTDDPDGASFRTFSETDAGIAKECMETGQPAAITYIKSQYGLEIKEIAIVGADEDQGDQGGENYSDTPAGAGGGRFTGLNGSQ